MKTFLANNWQTIVIVILAVVIGVIITRSCTRKPQTGSQISIDSLKTANEVLLRHSGEFSDSIKVVIQNKDSIQTGLSKQLQTVTNKYWVLINRSPDKDTVIKIREVYIGNECLEKLPIIQAQLTTCNSMLDDYKELVMVKTDQNNSLQKQFDRALAITGQQEKDAKILKRKIWWYKAGLVTESVVILGTAIYIVATK